MTMIIIRVKDKHLINYNQNKNLDRHRIITNEYLTLYVLGIRMTM